MMRLELSLLIALSVCLASLAFVGCTQYPSPGASQNTSTEGTPGGSRGIGTPAGNPIAAPSFVERAVLYPGPGQTEWSGSNETDHQQHDVLFIYLLMRPAADEDKRIEALRAYSCYVPSPGTGPDQSSKAVFLVPGKLIASTKLDEHDRSKLFQELSADGYDYDAANQLIWEVGRWSNTVPDIRGIFVVEVDHSISIEPRRGRAYDLAGLPSDMVRDWILDEISSIEGGWSANNLPEIHRAKPSWPEVIASVGNVFQVVPASKASGISASCP